MRSGRGLRGRRARRVRSSLTSQSLRLYCAAWRHSTARTSVSWSRNNVVMEVGVSTTGMMGDFGHVVGRGAETRPGSYVRS